VAFFGYFFLLQKKSDSPAGETQCLQIEKDKTPKKQIRHEEKASPPPEPITVGLPSSPQPTPR
jgi:hypothetical protein